MSISPAAGPALALDVSRFGSVAAGRGLRRVRSFLFGTPLAAVASVMLGLLIFLAIFGPMIWTANPNALNIAESLSAPSWHHLMGTDSLGRDVFSRFIHGARLSILLGLIVAVVGAGVGTLVGVVCGTVGGLVDSVAMRVMDAILAFPPLILAMAVTASLGAGLTTAGIGITLTTIPWYARLVRTEALALRERPFMEAAHAIGATRARIIRHHVIPHVVPTVLVQGAAVFGFAILTLAALGFIGLGVQPPTAEWGQMITDGLQYAVSGQWWIGVFPGVGVLLAVSAANVLADRARDLFDPRATMEG